MLLGPRILEDAEYHRLGVSVEYSLYHADYHFNVSYEKQGQGQPKPPISKKPIFRLDFPDCTHRSIAEYKGGKTFQALKEDPTAQNAVISVFPQTFILFSGIDTRKELFYTEKKFVFYHFLEVLRNSINDCAAVIVELPREMEFGKIITFLKNFFIHTFRSRSALEGVSDDGLDCISIENLSNGKVRWIFIPNVTNLPRNMPIEGVREGLFWDQTAELPLSLIPHVQSLLKSWLRNPGSFCFSRVNAPPVSPLRIRPDTLWVCDFLISASSPTPQEIKLCIDNERSPALFLAEGMLTEKLGALFAKMSAVFVLETTHYENIKAWLNPLISILQSTQNLKPQTIKFPLPTPPMEREAVIQNILNVIPLSSIHMTATHFSFTTTNQMVVEQGRYWVELAQPDFNVLSKLKAQTVSVVLDQAYGVDDLTLSNVLPPDMKVELTIKKMELSGKFFAFLRRRLSENITKLEFDNGTTGDADTFGKEFTAGNIALFKRLQSVVFVFSDDCFMAKAVRCLMGVFASQGRLEYLKHIRLLIDSSVGPGDIEPAIPGLIRKGIQDITLIGNPTAVGVIARYRKRFEKGFNDAYRLFEGDLSRTLKSDEVVTTMADAVKHVNNLNDLTERLAYYEQHYYPEPGALTEKKSELQRKMKSICDFIESKLLVHPFSFCDLLKLKQKTPESARLPYYKALNTVLKSEDFWQNYSKHSEWIRSLFQAAKQDSGYKIVFPEDFLIQFFKRQPHYEVEVLKELVSQYEPYSSLKKEDIEAMVDRSINFDTFHSDLDSFFSYLRYAQEIAGEYGELASLVHKQAIEGVEAYLRQYANVANLATLCDFLSKLSHYYEIKEQVFLQSDSLSRFAQELQHAETGKLDDSVIEAIKRFLETYKGIESVKLESDNFIFQLAKLWVLSIARKHSLPDTEGFYVKVNQQATLSGLLTELNQYVTSRKSSLVPNFLMSREAVVRKAVAKEIADCVVPVIQEINRRAGVDTGTEKEGLVFVGSSSNEHKTKAAAEARPPSSESPAVAGQSRPLPSAPPFDPQGESSALSFSPGRFFTPPPPNAPPFYPQGRPALSLSPVRLFTLPKPESPSIHDQLEHLVQTLTAESVDQGTTETLRILRQMQEEPEPAKHLERLLLNIVRDYFNQLPRGMFFQVMKDIDKLSQAIDLAPNASEKERIARAF